MFCHRTHAPCRAEMVRCHTRRASVLKHARLRLSGRYRTQLDTRRVCVTEREGPALGAFQCIAMFLERRSLGSGRQQLPVLRHDHRINLVNDSIRRDHVRPLDVGPIDLYLRPRYHRSQRAALQSHHVA
jgi:hypothetical protein